MIKEENEAHGGLVHTILLFLSSFSYGYLPYCLLNLEILVYMLFFLCSIFYFTFMNVEFYVLNVESC